jgi:glutathionylspermidine synthase
MLKFKKLAKSPEEVIKNAGWNWMLGDETLPYVVNEMIEVSEKEAEAYHQAAEELYEMMIEAAQNVINNNRFEELGIPKNLVEIIQYSWENDANWHIYGRFDLSGGLDNQSIKLIEFNADTATCLPETAIVQWASLKANGLNESKQFNTLFESLTESFETIQAENPSFENTILFATMSGFPEDDTNVLILAEAAKEAGFEIDFAKIEDIDFSAEKGIFKQNKDGSFSKFDFLFKLVPWEFIAWDEPELAAILTEITKKKLAIITNPAYTLLFQSKGILKILWELYPNHPLLLECSDKPLYNKKQVSKVLFGREGANIAIIEANGFTDFKTSGEYDEQARIYQEYTPFLEDNQGQNYQAGVFIASEPCGLGFRKGGKILDNKAQFCGHLIVD